MDVVGDDAAIAADAEPARGFRARTSMFSRRRPLFWLALVFSTGIFLDWWLEPRVQMLGGFFFASILGVTALFVFQQKEIHRLAVLSGALLMALSAGMLLHGLRARIPSADDISRRTAAAPSFVWLRGTILEASRPRTSGRKTALLSIDALGASEAALVAASGRVQLNLPPAIADTTNESIPTPEDIGEGDYIRVRVRLEIPPDITVPDSFDYREYLMSQNVYRVGALFPGSLTVISKPAWWQLGLLLRRTSARLANRLEEIFTDARGGSTDGERQAGLLNALLFGRRERVDASDRETFAETGMAHLLAISGLQIHFLAILLWRFASLFGISRRRSAWLVLATCCAYCALTGGAAPVMRATVMIAAYLAAMLCWREPDPLSVLGISALVILVAAPAELFSAGFQLSFMAVLALATLYPAFEDAWEAWREPGLAAMVLQPTVPRRQAWSAAYARKALFVSLAAMLGTAPVIAWHMGRFSTLTFAMNLIALPLGNICMLCGLAALAASALSLSAAAYVAMPAVWLTALLEWMTARIAWIPFSAIDVPAPPTPILFVYAAALLFVWVRRGNGMTMGRLSVIVPACLVVLNAGILFREGAPAPSVTILDLKQGRAALVEAPSGGTAMIDSGGIGQGPRIAEMLRRQGVRRLSLLVISVDEHDAIGGALDLLRRVAVQSVILPRAGFPSEERRELERFLTQQGIPYHSPGVAEVLQGPGDIHWNFCDDGPAADMPAATRTALSVRVTLPGTRILFVPARFASSLQRLIAKAGPEFLAADLLRVTPDNSGFWPSQTAELVHSCGCHTVIAGSGSDAEEAPGLDLGALANARDIQLVSPHRDGSVRVQADVGTGASPLLQAFRGGEWRPIR